MPSSSPTPPPSITALPRPRWSTSPRPSPRSSARTASASTPSPPAPSPPTCGLASTAWPRPWPRPPGGAPTLPARRSSPGSAGGAPGARPPPRGGPPLPRPGVPQGVQLAARLGDVPAGAQDDLAVAGPEPDLAFGDDGVLVFTGVQVRRHERADRERVFYDRQGAAGIAVPELEGDADH